MKDNSKENDRWLKAQSAERAYWKNPKHAKYGDKEGWKIILKDGFDFDFDFFKDKDVLEIGSGPNGIIFNLTPAKSRIGLEPMNMSDIIEDWKKPFVKMGKGEDLPFDDNSFDVIICFNVLDHTIDPDLVLAECKRVLREKGQMLFQMHVLRTQYKIFRPILNKIDSPHPYHLTSNETKSKFTRYFQIIHERIFNGLSTRRKHRIPRNPKYFVGNIVMKNLFLLLDKN